MRHVVSPDWREGLAYKLSIGVAVVTVLVSLMDIFYAPIFVRETASSKAQVIGQDLVNLVLGVPALLLSMSESRRGSVKARTIWLGILAYFAYTFLSYCVIFKLNQGFLVYTAAFGLSFYATLLNLSGMRMDRMNVEASPSTRKWTPYSMVLILLIIALLWTPDIVAYYTTGRLPTAMTVDGVHTLIIPFQDFSILLPLALITAWLIRREDKMGYILAPVVLVKALSIALAVIGMIVAMQLYGMPVVLGQALIFTVGAVLIGFYTRHYFNGIQITEIEG